MVYSHIFIASAIRGANLVQFLYVMESGQSYQPD